MSFKEGVGPQLYKRLLPRCFLVNFAKFLRKLILYNTCQQLLNESIILKWVNVPQEYVHWKGFFGYSCRLIAESFSKKIFLKDIRNRLHFWKKYALYHRYFCVKSWKPLEHLPIKTHQLSNNYGLNMQKWWNFFIFLCQYLIHAFRAG